MGKCFRLPQEFFEEQVVFQLRSKLRFDLPYTQPKQHHARNCRFEHLEKRQLLAADFVPSGVVDHPGGPTGSISGSAFGISPQADCADHLASQALSGAMIQLLDEHGHVLEQQRTDDTGSYRFTDLMPGQYALRQQPLLTSSEISVHMGGNDGFIQSANELIVVTVTAGTTTSGYDFCNRLNDFDGDFEFKKDNDNSFFISSLTLQEPSTALLVQPTFESVPIEFGAPAQRTLASPTLLQQSLKLETYGGSARRASPTSKVDTWYDELFDEVFSATMLGEIAAITLPYASYVTQKGDFSASSEHDETDAVFAEGATITSMASTSESTAIAIGELFDVYDESADELVDVTQVARLPEN